MIDENKICDAIDTIIRFAAEGRSEDDIVNALDALIAECGA